MEVGDPLVDPKTTVPKDFDAYVLTPEGDKAWQATRDRLIGETALARQPAPTDADVRAALKLEWDAKRNAGNEGKADPAGAYGMTPPAGGPAAPQSGTDMMSVTPKPLPSDPSQAVTGATYTARDANGGTITVRWDGQKYVSVN
jgi:hypothetical protein